MFLTGPWILATGKEGKYWKRQPISGYLESGVERMKAWIIMS